MCDAGRLNYKWINREDRLTSLQGSKLAGANRNATWPRALAAISEILGQSPPGAVAIIASARQTNEELYLLKYLAAKLGAMTDSVPRMAEGDKLLLNADRNPNATGSCACGDSFHKSRVVSRLCASP